MVSYLMWTNSDDASGRGGNPAGAGSSGREPFGKDGATAQGLPRRSFNGLQGNEMASHQTASAQRDGARSLIGIANPS